MLKVEIYYADWCPYCKKALDIFKKKNIKYILYNIDKSNKIKEESIKRSGKTSIPQIFIGNKYIGGFDELNKLNKQNKLNYIFNI